MDARTEKFEQMCRDCGCDFKGIQSNFGIKGLPELVLFDNAYHSTLALPVELCTPAAMARKLAASEQSQWRQQCLQNGGQQ
jgi:hypothetical protein